MNTQHQEVTPIPPEHGVHISLARPLRQLVKRTIPGLIYCSSVFGTETVIFHEQIRKTGQRYASSTTLEISMKYHTSRFSHSFSTGILNLLPNSLILYKPK